VTLDEIRSMDKDVITPAIAAQVLNCNPHWIRVAAHQDKSLLGFPVILIRNRVKISEAPLVLSQLFLFCFRCLFRLRDCGIQ